MIQSHDDLQHGSHTDDFMCGITHFMLQISSVDIKRLTVQYLSRNETIWRGKSENQVCGRAIVLTRGLSEMKRDHSLSVRRVAVTLWTTFDRCDSAFWAKGSRVEEIMKTIRYIVYIARTSGATRFLLILLTTNLAIPESKRKQLWNCKILKSRQLIFL